MTVVLFVFNLEITNEGSIFHNYFKNILGNALQRESIFDLIIIFL